MADTRPSGQDETGEAALRGLTIDAVRHGMPLHWTAPDRNALHRGENLGVATVSNEADEIRRQMAQIRRDLHEDVREVVAGAEAVTDWRRYVRAYPWVAVSAAAAVGYLVVPRARRSVPADIARQADLTEVREALQRTAESSSGTKEKTRKSLLGAAFAMAAPLAWRVAQNYAMAYLEQWIAQLQHQHMAHAGHPPGHPEAPRRAPAPGQPGGADRPRGI